MAKAHPQNLESDLEFDPKSRRELSLCNPTSLTICPYDLCISRLRSCGVVCDCPAVSRRFVTAVEIIPVRTRMQTSNKSSSGSAARVEDERDPEEVKIAKKEEKEIDSITDFHVEKESEKLSNALLSFTDSSQTEAAKQAIIVIPPAHVLAFSEECDVTKEQAESLLRKHGGNFKAALSAYIKGL